MSAVRFADSLKYGLVIFAYFVGVTVIGVGGLVLGGLLAIPELLNWIDGGGYAAAELAGGSILMALGATVWFTGLFGIARKMLADAVSTGVAHGQGDIIVEIDQPAEATDEPTRQVSRATNGTSTAGGSAAAGSTTDSEPETASEPGTATGSETGESEPATADAEGEPGSAASADADTESESDGGAPRAETDAGERGWSGGWTSTDEEQPAAGPDTDRNAEAGPDPEIETDAEGEDGAEDQRKQTAEEIAFGSSRGEPMAKTDDVGGSPNQPASSEETNTGAEQPGSETSEHEGERESDSETDESVTDLWETPGDDAAADGDSTAAEPAEGEQSDNAESTETANSSSSDPLADRLSEE